MKSSNWVGWLMRSYRITFLILFLLVLLGVLGFLKMPKAEFPEFTVRQGVVVAVYPGATSEEVESEVARPLERYLFTQDEVKRRKTTTTSSNGLCVCMVELEDYVSNKDEVWSKLKHGLNSFKQTLPGGVLALIVNDDFGSASSILLAISSKSRSVRELCDYSDEIADALRRIESVSNVVLYGDVKEQITITVDQRRMSAYGIGRSELITALQSAGMTTLSGSVTTPGNTMPIHLARSGQSEREIEEMVLFSGSDGHLVRVRDIAEVEREYDRSESFIDYNGVPSVLLSLEMKENNNIVQYGKDVQAVLDDFIANRIPADVTLSRITDQCQVVGDSVNDFMLNMAESMGVIIIVMLILFPWRTAVVAGLTVPLSTFISIGVMYMSGIPLNTVTLAGLIIVLGMVVDNAIVVLDGYLEFVNKGLSRWHAAAASAQHYFMPMMLATLCISVIFFPFIFILKGMYGDFVYYLPWTILINLMVSLLLAVVFIPVMEFLLIKPKKKRKESLSAEQRTEPVDDEIETETSSGGSEEQSAEQEEKEASKPAKEKKSLNDYVQSVYEKLLRLTFRFPWSTIIVAILLIVGSVVFIVPNLKVRMMPLAERNQFAVEITLPEGSGLGETRQIADSVYNVLARDSSTVSITRFLGCSSPRFHTAYAPKMAGRNYAQFIVNTLSQESTIEMLDRYEPMLSEHFPKAFVKMKQIDFQDYNPFEYRFYGTDADSLEQASFQLRKVMERREDMMNVHTDWQSPRPYINVSLDNLSAAQVGISRPMAELQLSMSTGSVKIGQVWEENYEVPIVLKEHRRELMTPEDVNDLYISSPVLKGGASVGTTDVPLRQIGTAKVAWGQSSIVHRGGERCLTLTCDLKRNLLTQPVHDAMKAASDSLRLPDGVRFETGGEPESNEELMGIVATGLVISVIIIFFFILFNFKTYKLTFTCIAAITLCLPGTLIGLLCMNRMMGITAIFGFITLMGMIMRNEILIFEHAGERIRQGWSARDAAYDAGKRRMIPIFLTTATTAVGVIPMIVAATSFWMPVGVAIFAGGIGSLVMVVLVLPVVYWKLYQK